MPEDGRLKSHYFSDEPRTFLSHDCQQNVFSLCYLCLYFVFLPLHLSPTTTQSVLDTLDLVEKEWGNMSDVVGVWLQDWTGQRVFGEDGGRDLPRVGLWWNWEVRGVVNYIIMTSTNYIKYLCDFKSSE